MGLITTPSTILKVYAYSETSKILRLLTRDDGLRSVIAKGARRPKSRFGGVLEPFTDGIATFYEKEGRDLHTLSGFELRKERQSLGRSLERYAGAGLITEITLKTAPSAADRELFRQLRRGLDRLVSEETSVEAAVLEEAWRLIVCLGFRPSVDRCAGCGRVPSGEVRFDVAAGSIRCEACAARPRPPTTRALSPPAFAELRALVSGDPYEGGFRTARFQRGLLRDFITWHIVDGRTLNSFRFLEDDWG